MDIDKLEQDEEHNEERKAADGKPRRLAVEVTALPKVNRGRDGGVTSAVIPGKARFKGEVTLHLRGEVAAAYWSVTPGMKLSVSGVETEDRAYEVVALDVLAQG